jgi:MFS family permease
MIIPMADSATSVVENRSQTVLTRLGQSTFLISLPFGMMLFGLPLIAREMGASTLAFSGLLAVYALLIVAVQPLVGWGLDHLGRRKFLIAGLIGYAVSNAVFGFVSNVRGLFLAQVAQGVGSGLFWLAALAVISDLASEDLRGKEFGRLEEMTFRGILLGTLVGILLFSLVNFNVFGRGLSLLDAWRVLFILFSFASIIATVIAFRGIPETAEIISGATNPEPKQTTKEKVNPPIKKRMPGQLWILLTIVVLTAGAIEFLSPIFIPYLFDNISENLLFIAIAFLPAAIAGATLPSRLGNISDKVGRRKPMVIALLVGGFTTLFLPFILSLWPLAVFLFLEAAVFAAATPAEEALVIDIVDEKNEGLALGLYTTALGVGGIIGPLMGGYIYSHYGSTVLFTSSALLMVFGALLIWLIIREPEIVE